MILSTLCRKGHHNNSCNHAFQFYYNPCRDAWQLTKYSLQSYLGPTWEDNSSWNEPECKFFHFSWISLISLVIVFLVIEGKYPKPSNWVYICQSFNGAAILQCQLSDNTAVPNHINFPVIVSICFCLTHQMGTLLTFGSNSIDDIMPGRPNQSQKIDLRFLITQLYHINQFLHDFCKAPVESAVSNSCLAYLPTPGPSVVPVNWLALPGRSKKWGWGVLSVSPLLQTPTGFPWQQLVTSLIFCLPAGCRSGGGGLFGKLFGEVCCSIPVFPTSRLSLCTRSWQLMETSCRFSLNV